MSLVRRAGIAGVMAAALAATTFVAPSTAVRRDPVEVTPSTLAVGATPMVAWYRSAGQEIVWPGHRPVRITPRSTTGPNSHPLLLNARNGWLRVYRDRTSFVGTDGKTRWRGQPPRYGFTPFGQTVAVDGRTFVDLVDRWTRSGTFSGTTVRVLRTRDGKVLRSRTFPHTMVRVHGVTSSVVALDMIYPRAGNTVYATKYWNQRTGRLRVFRSHREPGSPPSGFERGPAASLSHHLIAADGAIRSSRTGRVLWRLHDELAVSFSPDGTRVATFGDYLFSLGDLITPRVMRIRDARTGAILATFHGLFSFSDQQGPFWESESTVLVVAHDAIVFDESIDEDRPTGTAWIRCTTAGSCERVPIDASTDFVTIPRSR